MARHRLHAAVFHGCRVVQWVAGIIAALLAGSSKAEPDKIRPHVPLLASALEWVQQWSWTAAVIMIAIGILQLLRTQMGPPWVWHAVHKILDKYRDEVFREQFTRDANERLDHHRVTLFRHVSWLRVCWRLPWGARLIPLERSGHLTQRTRACFLAPDDGDRAEGIAGLAWSRKHPIAISGLPELRLDSPSVEIEDYAQKTNVSTKRVTKAVKKGKRLPRSLCGIMVEVKGLPWGVVVLDSQKPEAISPEQVDAYRSYGILLVPLLERV